MTSHLSGGHPGKESRAWIVRQKVFEGPLDLLLFLIQIHELDISTISVSQITNQYLDYVRVMQELNFDLASEFLVMAATLIYWKSKALLPDHSTQSDPMESPEDGPPNLQELVHQLLERKKFSVAGQEIGRRPLLGEEVFKRFNPKPPIEKIWKEMELTQLSLSYQDILMRAKNRVQILKKETVSISQKIDEIGNRLKLGEWVKLEDIVDSSNSWSEVVVSFLASLELGRLQKLRLHQEGAYTTIYLELIESLAHFDLTLATGFSSEIQEIQSPKAGESAGLTGNPVIHEVQVESPNPSAL